MPPRLNEALVFPPIESANRLGMLAIGGDLSTERLLLAYRSGIFPWGGDPVDWYAPDPRCVVYVPDARDRLPRRLMRSARLWKEWKSCRQSAACPPTQGIVLSKKPPAIS